MPNVIKLDSGQVRIDNCVALHPHLFEARRFQNKPNSDLRFSVVVVLPQLTAEDSAVFSDIMGAICAANFPQGVPADFASPFHPCDAKYPDFAGRYYMNCGTSVDRPPQVVQENPNEKAVVGSVYPGCGVTVVLGGYTYDKGFSFGLNILQITNRSLPVIQVSGVQAATVLDTVPVQAAAATPVAVAGEMPTPVSPTPHQPSPAAAPAAPVAPGAPAAAPAAPVAPGAPGVPGPTIQ